MANTVPKLALSRSRDIPFDRLVLSQANVRRLKCGVSIGELADDIMRRTLLQSLNVRAVLDDEGNETGKFEVPAGGRRFRALELLVTSKRMAKNQPVPCILREGGSAEEDSLVENTMRMPLHPLDQFRAFKALRDAGTTATNVETVRYYEKIGLLPPPARTSANYRAYGSEHLARLSFIRRARDLGFTLEAVRELLTLSDDKAQSCEAVDGIARVHLGEIDRKIGDLTSLRGELDRVIGSCRHGTVADCKIIETLGPRSAA